MLRKVSEAGKGRTANKLRAYVRAAYQCALDVNSLASIPKSFKDFEIVANPAAMTKRNSKDDKADKNPLSLLELRTYWKAIAAAPGAKGAALRLHLLTGGQRVRQLVQLLNKNVAPETITIFDAKGRPGTNPRPHTLPLIAEAKASLAMFGNGKVYAISSDGGETPLSATTLSNWACDVEHGIPNFQLKRVRSGVETALAAARISREIRGHLQSHGQTGVQARHYDGHDYIEEKLEALRKLFSLISE